MPYRDDAEAGKLREAARAVRDDGDGSARQSRIDALIRRAHEGPRWERHVRGSGNGFELVILVAAALLGLSSGGGPAVAALIRDLLR